MTTWALVRICPAPLHDAAGSELAGAVGVPAHDEDHGGAVLLIDLLGRKVDAGGLRAGGRGRRRQSHGGRLDALRPALSVDDGAVAEETALLISE